MVEIGSENFGGHSAEYQIRNESLYGLIKTIPVEPVSGHIILLAEGIRLPYGRDQKNWTKDDIRYVKECVTYGVVPFSKSHFMYSPEHNLFMPKESTINLKSGENHPRVSNLIARHVGRTLMSGGKRHINVFDFVHLGGLTNLKEEVLGMLAEKRYEMVSGVFHFFSQDLKEYAGNHANIYADTTLILRNGGPKKSVAINIGRSVNENDFWRLIDWSSESGADGIEERVLLA